ncbi:MAG: tRNA lysidine(34) synthetase TilS [Syntrophorhabdaceae bacterium]|nr:tRNA lysidine(34) synthetase TilS [Syntrophorhabdaceae bacterium]MDD4197167.1 tRNA lysidine(34) synthetase TilS [Syntrophorhabdaceae bacterium]
MAKFIPDLIGRTIKLIREQALITGGDRVLLGLSGGIDSTTLLFVLNEVRKEIGFDLGIAHINHLLRGVESERDQAFVKDTAAQYGLKLFLKRADVKSYAESRGLSLQHAGRDIRYQFLDEIADTAGFTRIATAHNLDDQIETFVLRLIKGSGIRGLSSIPPVRNRIIRPFLNIYRSEIEAFAALHSIVFVEDSSNEKTVYERNYVRHRIMPLFEGLNPAFREKIASLLHDINDINTTFERKKEAFMKLARHAEKDVTIPLEPFRALDEEVRYRVMADIFASLAPSFIPLREHMRLIEKMIASTRPNLRIDLPSGLKAKKIYCNLILTTRPTPRATGQMQEVHSGMNHISHLNIDVNVQKLTKAPLTFPKDSLVAYFDADKCNDLAVRTFRPGDRIRPLGMTQHVKLKDFFISRKIPLEDRRHIPLLLSGDEIIWIVGHRIDDGYKLTGNTRNILKVTVKKTCQPSPDYD